MSALNTTDSEIVAAKRRSVALVAGARRGIVRAIALCDLALSDELHATAQELRVQGALTPWDKPSGSMDGMLINKY